MIDGADRTVNIVAGLVPDVATVDTSKMLAGLVADVTKYDVTGMLGSLADVATVDTSKMLAGLVADVTKYDVTGMLGSLADVATVDTSKMLAGLVADVTKYDVTGMLGSLADVATVDTSKMLAGLVADVTKYDSAWTSALTDIAVALERFDSFDLDAERLEVDDPYGVHFGQSVRDLLVVLYCLILVGMLAANAGVGALDSIDVLDNLNYRYPEINSVFELVSVFAWAIPICVWLAKRQQSGE